MTKFIDALDFRPDSFKVAPKHEWRIMKAGRSTRTGVQPRFCGPNCEFYLQDADKKCKIFYECDHFVFDMHTIAEGEIIFEVMFATEETPPYDGLSWIVSETQLRTVLGRKLNREVDEDKGRKKVNEMLDEYNALKAQPKEGIVID
jgi:hypothetical protein